MILNREHKIKNLRVVLNSGHKIDLADKHQTELETHLKDFIKAKMMRSHMAKERKSL